MAQKSLERERRAGFTELIGAGPVGVKFCADDQDPDERIAAAMSERSL